MCAPPSEKPLCFSCLPVCIVVQGKIHTQFLLRRFSIWRCPLYIIDLCRVDHSILYTKGAFCVCTFERPLAICVPHGPVTFPLCYSAFSPFFPIGQKGSLLVVTSRYIS